MKRILFATALSGILSVPGVASSLIPEIRVGEVAVKFNGSLEALGGIRNRNVYVYGERLEEGGKIQKVFVKDKKFSSSVSSEGDIDKGGMFFEGILNLTACMRSKSGINYGVSVALDGTTKEKFGENLLSKSAFLFAKNDYLSIEGGAAPGVASQYKISSSSLLPIGKSLSENVGWFLSSSFCSMELDKTGTAEDQITSAYDFLILPELPTNNFLLQDEYVYDPTEGARERSRDFLKKTFRSFYANKLNFAVRNKSGLTLGFTLIPNPNVTSWDTDFQDEIEQSSGLKKLKAVFQGIVRFDYGTEEEGISFAVSGERGSVDDLHLKGEKRKLSALETSLLWKKRELKVLGSYGHINKAWFGVLDNESRLKAESASASEENAALLELDTQENTTYATMGASYKINESCDVAVLGVITKRGKPGGEHYMNKLRYGTLGASYKIRENLLAYLQGVVFRKNGGYNEDPSSDVIKVKGNYLLGGLRFDF